MRALLLVSAVVLGCSEAAAPAAPVFEGRYLAESVAGKSIPGLLVEIPDSAGTIQVYLVADTLDVQAGGRYIQHAHIEGRINGQLVGQLRWSDHGVYTRDGNRVSFDSDYIENVQFQADYAADGRLHVTQDLTGEAGPMVHVFAPVNR
jgi:hypothetical protein